MHMRDVIFAVCFHLESAGGTILKLSYEKPFFICRASVDERKKPESAGFTLDQEKGVYFTKHVQVAARLRQYADDRTTKILNRFLIDVKPWPGRIQFPEGLTPLPFQPDAARFSLERNRSYLALDPGLGKTIVACLIMNGLGPDYFIVYVCPPFLTLNIEDEITQWCTPKRQVKIQGRDRGLTRGVWIIPDSRLDKEIVHQKLAALIAHAKREGKRIALFVDEAHRFNSEKSGRGLYLMEAIAPKLHHKQVWMSGSPRPNRSIELYPILSKCAPETIDFMSKNEFGKTFCGARFNGWGYDFKGTTNDKELARRVLGKFMLRLRKSILKLPPLTEELLIIGDKMAPQIAELDLQILKQFSPEDLMGGLAVNEHVSTYRKELGKIKAKAALPFLVSLMEDTDENVIVGTVHRETLSILREGLSRFNPVHIDGSVPANQRVPIAKDWQRDPKKRLMILNNRAGGIGLNLQKATRVPLVEFDWVYDTNRQLFDRAHRFGQTNPVLVQYLVYKNSIDRKVVEVFMRKKSMGQVI